MSADLLAMRIGDETNIIRILLIICVFWVLISRTDAIRSLFLFRMGCLILAASLILPPLVYIAEAAGIDLTEAWETLSAEHLLVFVGFPFLVMSLGPGKDRKSRSD